MKKFGSVCLYIFAFVIAGLFLFACIDGAKDVSVSLDAADREVELQATITSTEKYTEIDEGMETDYWKTYVSYDYNGQHYSYVYYDQLRSEPALGKVVTVRIDPNNPGELLPSHGEFILSMLMSPLFLAGISYLGYAFLQSVLPRLLKKKNDDIPAEEHAYDKPAFFIIVGLLAIISLICYHQQGSLVFAVFSLVAIVLLALLNRYLSKKDAKEKPCT